MRKPTKTNTILIAIIGVLTLALLVRLDPAPHEAAWAQGAQPLSGDPPFNATEQRKQMIASLSQINSRLTTIENKLSTTLNVKVTEMPPVVIKESAKKDK